MRAYFGELFAAFPDFTLEIVDTVAEGDRVAVRWQRDRHVRRPGTFQGIEPTGARLDLEGFDLLIVRDGLIVAQRRLHRRRRRSRARSACCPRRARATEERMTKAFNAKTRVGRASAAASAERDRRRRLARARRLPDARR